MDTKPLTPNPQRWDQLVTYLRGHGGNQREKSREKAAKKLKEQEKRKGGSDKEGPNKGMTLEERRHRDAEIMRQKQVAKAEAEEEKGAVGGASK